MVWPGYSLSVNGPRSSARAARRPLNVTVGARHAPRGRRRGTGRVHAKDELRPVNESPRRLPLTSTYVRGSAPPMTARVVSDLRAAGDSEHGTRSSQVDRRRGDRSACRPGRCTEPPQRSVISWSDRIAMRTPESDSWSRRSPDGRPILCRRAKPTFCLHSEFGRSKYTRGGDDGVPGRRPLTRPDGLVRDPNSHRVLAPHPRALRMREVLAEFRLPTILTCRVACEHRRVTRRHQAPIDQTRPRTFVDI